VRAAVALLFVVALIAGCEVFPGVTPTGPLVTIESRGGQCVDSPCDRTVAIERDGRVHEIAPQPGDMRRLPDAIRLGLEQAIQAADFNRLRSRRFTGECPADYDGQEWIYTFGTADGPVRLATCEVQIDASDPLFAALEAALSVSRQ
jgi:hypothetical protein